MYRAYPDLTRVPSSARVARQTTGQNRRTDGIGADRDNQTYCTHGRRGAVAISYPGAAVPRHGVSNGTRRDCTGTGPATIQHLRICRFKSIRDVSLNCRRVNVLIGGPNTGKSNLLEALALWSWLGAPERRPLSDFVRMNTVTDLFYRGTLDEPVSVTLQTPNSQTLQIVYRNGLFELKLDDTPCGHLGPDGQVISVDLCIHDAVPPVLFYRFRAAPPNRRTPTRPLLPPDGSNLFEVVFTSNELRKWFRELCGPFRLQPLFKPATGEIELLEQTGEIAISYPLHAASETLRRTLFYQTAIETAGNATLVFEEPEVHAFPDYVRFLGKQIALDHGKQYFLTTHNPYMFTALVEKTPAAELHVLAVYRDGLETKVHCLTDSDLARLLDGDPFFELEKTLSKKRLGS